MIFVSGACSLVYQTVWMRSFRLIFGASTMACAAVVAIFMGGLGLGSYLLGKRVDKDPSPLKRYAQYELAVALSAALSPLLIWCAQKLYYATGGSAVLGLGPSYLIRLLLAALVLGVPTFFMGGTLVAAVASVQSEQDKARAQLGRLYGANTAGAVVGCLLTTFVTIEVFGVSRSLWLACLMNLLLAVYAFKLDREKPATAQVKPVETPENTEVSGETWPDVQVSEASPKPSKLGKVQSSFLLFCSAWVGFAFFAMEMVWYRIFAPLLGGSSYSFGIVLAVALAGIAVGGWIFGRRKSTQATFTLFSLSCALEALWLALPFAVGDHMATMTLALRNLGIFGFWGIVSSWSVVATMVVFLPAVLAGFQFPALVSLLGVGNQDIGQDVGRVYAFNTLGAIAGAVGSGFGLMSWFGANALWVALTISLVVLAMTGLVLAGNRGLLAKHRGQTLASVGAASLAVLCCLAEGPSAAMRHSPIGAGRFRDAMNDQTKLENRYRATRRNIVWEADGREVTVGVSGGDSYSFIVNGKVDGNVRGDAGTQVMCPLIGALIHGAPERGLVIGLGTGMSAGWLSQVRTMKKVDVVELEPAILKMAELSRHANFDVLSQDHVEVHITDGREFLQTTEHRYDIVMSEPSNPYRVGIASLFSQDFYRYVQSRLTEDGVFVQWLQIYEVDAQTVRTVIATLGSVFPSVEIWQTQGGDLSLVARNEVRSHDLETLAQNVGQEPYKSALSKVWGVSGVSGFFSGFVASHNLATQIVAAEQDWVDTDEMPLVEFGFSRTVGQSASVTLQDLRLATKSNDASLPQVNGQLDWPTVLEAQDVRAHFLGSSHGLFPDPPKETDARTRAKARQFARQDRFKECLEIWRSQPQAAVHPGDQMMLVRGAAVLGDAEFEQLLAPVAQRNAIDGLILRAIYEHHHATPQQTAQTLIQTYRAAREDVWYNRANMSVALNLTAKVLSACKDEELQRKLFASLSKPFAGHVVEVMRRRTLLAASNAANFKETCQQALAPFEREGLVPLEVELLRTRYKCYQENQDALVDEAKSDLMEVMEIKSPPFFLGSAP